MNVFREEGGTVKTEEEKRQMAEKRRFKQNREFKKRLEEQEENAEADIRSFKFRSLERNEPKERKKTQDFKERKDTKFNKNRGGHDKFDRSGGKKTFRGGRDHGPKGRRFNHEDED